MRDENITSFVKRDVIVYAKYAFKFFYELKKKIPKAGKNLEFNLPRLITNTSPEIPNPYHHFAKRYYIKNPQKGFLFPRNFKIVLLPRRVSRCKIDLLEHNLPYNNLMLRMICI